MSGKLLYALGRRHAPDPRDAAHLMRTALAPIIEPLPTHRYWTPGPVLDQGQVPACVGYAWKQWLQTSPVRHAADALEASTIYHEAQVRDEWPGEDYDGTSVRGGAKYMQEAGRLSEYVWATRADDIARWLLTTGPVVLGTNWYSEMFSPEEGIAHVAGSIAGGHAYLAIGYSAHAQMFRCVNSWGPGWSQRGRFWLTMPDMMRLLSEDGEACTAVELAP